MFNKTTQNTGKIGENATCAFLQRQGFKIIDRNYWKKWGEIDVVAQKGLDLRFVEVKTVVRKGIGKGGDDYEPEDNLHPWKRKRLRRVIETYLLDKRVDDEVDWQVDAVSIYLTPDLKTLKIDHLEDIIL